MSEKTINYMARDYNTIKSELIALSKQYYPELADSFNDASVGSWIIDLVSAVGDDLNYYIDRCYNEQNVNSAALKSSVLNVARMNNVKIPGPKAAMCEIEITVTLNGVGNSSTSTPNWQTAPRIAQGAIVTNGSVDFEILEDVDFAEQFNRDAVSNRRWKPIRNARGVVMGYDVTKTVLASAGRSRIYKRVLTSSDIKPFMEVLLPFQNIMNIEGVLFKETSNLSIQPSTFEFYINAERFRMSDESIMTYRFFEVNSLVDQYVFGEEVVTPGEIRATEDPHEYVEYDYGFVNEGSNKILLEYPTAKYYKGSWMPLMQKFITEYTDTGYLKLIFGSGNNSQSVEEDGEPSAYAKHVLTKMVNNDLTGILPKAGWTMYILYRDGGGKISNVSVGSINRLSSASWSFPNIELANIDNVSAVKQRIINSVKVSNSTRGMSGVDAPSVGEIRYLTRYNTSAQNRCVTVKDYELRMKMMPAKYGGPYRCRAIEDNNKVLLYMLGLTSDGKLTNTLPNVVINNAMNYLTRFKSLGDIVELRSGNIYKLKATVGVYVDKAYNKQNVVKSIIATVNNFFSIEEHVMGEDIFVGELEKQISSIDGVANLISLRLFSVGAPYAPLPMKSDDSTRNEKEIDLNACGKVLTCDAQGMFEIEDMTRDIKVQIAAY